MRIVFVTSDWAFTGPADPMLGAAAALRARGHAVSLVCPESPDPSEAGVAGVARERGLEPALRIEAARGVRPWRDRRDAAPLRALLEASDAQLVQAWHSRGHALAWLASRARRGRGQSALVRSHREAEAPAAWPWHRWLYGPGCDGLWCVSRVAAERSRALRGGRPVAGALGGIDLERFATTDEQREAARAAFRGALGLPDESALIGVVARVQRHRRFDLLLRAFRALAERRSELHLVVLGRGTHLDEVAREPARALGLAERVHFPGHLPGQCYVEALRALDLCTFLVPGSDGGCRALLETAACGIPSVVSRRGALPEIVESERTGLLVDERAGALVEAWERLLGDASLRREFGRAAAQRAHSEFGAAALAQALEAFYEEVLARAGVLGSSAPPRSPC